MSFRFAKVLYIMPLLFAFSPILNFDNPTGAAWTMITATVGVVAFAAWTMGYLHRATTTVEWFLLAAAAMMCFTPLDMQILGFAPSYAVNIAGGILLASVSLWQRQTMITAKKAG